MPGGEDGGSALTSFILPLLRHSEHCGRGMCAGADAGARRQGEG